MPDEIEPVSAPDEDLGLLVLTGQGDREAFSRLYDRFSGVLFATALTILNDRGAAEDVLQEAFLTIWEKAPLYDAGRGRPLTWAIALTRNKAIDRLRSAQRRERLHSGAERESLTGRQYEEQDAAASLSGSEIGARVRLALAQHSAEQRQSIELTFFGSLTHIEVAERLREPLGTVKARIRRGLLRLRELLADDIG